MSAKGIDAAKRAWFKKIGYEPHPPQWLYHDSKARFRVPVCGRRFGKSSMAGRDLEPKLLKPKSRYWIVGPTYDLGEKEFRVVWDDLIIGLQLGRDKRVKKAYNKRVGDMYIEFPWQTRLEVRSADHPELLVGEALDGVIMSEAAKQRKETWERFIRPSLADKRGFADFPTTPEGFNWLHEMWQYGANPEFPDFESWKFPSWANTAVYPDGINDAEILLLRKTTTPEWFEQEIGADFASFVGKIFPEWDEFTHVRVHEFRPDWPNYMCFDWGYTNPLACIEFQVGPDDKIYIWREWYKPYLTLEQHLAMMADREQPEDYHITLAFGDAADPASAEYVTQHLVSCVVDPDAKKKEMWGVGIRIMRGFMQPRPSSTSLIVIDEYGTPAPDEPAYFVDPSCTNTIREHNNYKSKEPIKGQNVPELGQKIQDHTIDALRYALVQLFHLGISHHLSEVMYTPPKVIPGKVIVGDQFAITTGSSFGTDAEGYFSSSKEF